MHEKRPYSSKQQKASNNCTTDKGKKKATGKRKETALERKLVVAILSNLPAGTH